MSDNTIKRIASKELVPVDRVAARVTRGGINYTPNKKILTDDSDLPLPTIPNPSSVHDLSGHKFGRFVVTGWFAGGGKWVVKCNCGIYTTRKTKAVTNPNNKQDRCERCRHLAFLRREEHWRIHGKDINIDEL